MLPRFQIVSSKHSENMNALLMGLLLGNTGFCCPDPVFLSIIPFIAASGDMAQGALLATAYGLGRATPLIAIVMLARTGVDAMQVVVRHKRTFDRAIGWALIAIGTFIVYPATGHHRTRHQGGRRRQLCLPSRRMAGTRRGAHTDETWSRRIGGPRPNDPPVGG